MIYLNEESTQSIFVIDCVKYNSYSYSLNTMITFIIINNRTQP